MQRAGRAGKMVAAAPRALAALAAGGQWQAVDVGQRLRHSDLTGFLGLEVLGAAPGLARRQDHGSDEDKAPTGPPAEGDTDEDDVAALATDGWAEVPAPTSPPQPADAGVAAQVDGPPPAHPGASATAHAADADSEHDEKNEEDQDDGGGDDGDDATVMAAWAPFGLDAALVRGLRAQGFLTPTPIQAAALPAALLARRYMMVYERVCMYVCMCVCVITCVSHERGAGTWWARPTRARARRWHLVCRCCRG
jgi:hypothetical protein